MKRIATQVVVLALLVAASGDARAQELEEPEPRQGYYVAGGLHAALQHNRDEGDGLGVWPGFATTIRLGQLLTRRLGLGFQLDVGGGSREGESSSLIGLGLGGQVVVAPNLALHAVVGLGVVTLTETVAGEEELRGSYSAAYTVGITYDWFPRPCSTGGWAVTPALQLRAVPGDPITSFAATIGLEISYWTGLPKNQLELPPERAFTRD